MGKRQWAAWAALGVMGCSGLAVAPPAVGQGGMVPVPSFDTPPRRAPAPPAAPQGDMVPVPSLGTDRRVPAAPPAAPPGPAPQPPATPPAPPVPGGESCRSGPSMESREFTQPEVLGRPPGDRARMCFYRRSGSITEYLHFFTSGHFYHTSVAGSGGFAMGGAVHGTVRGTYGFMPGGRLGIRVGYQGIGVSQTTRGAGSERSLDVAGQSALERQMTLPNCQKITYRDEIKSVQLARGRGHPDFIVVDGVRWESFSGDCPAWQGWIKD